MGSSIGRWVTFLQATLLYFTAIFLEFSCIDESLAIRDSGIIESNPNDSLNLMLHHISVAVNNPRHVAEVLAEVLKGSVVPFPPNPDSYVTLAGDEFGTLFEFYPMGSELIPDAHEGQAGFQINPQTTQYTSFHAAISVPISLEEIERIGDREGWRVLLANRDGLFDVVEFWVENRLMLELLTPAIAAKYLEAFNPQNLFQLVNQLSLAETRR